MGNCQTSTVYTTTNNIQSTESTEQKTILFQDITSLLSSDESTINLSSAPAVTQSMHLETTNEQFDDSTTKSVLSTSVAKDLNPLTKTSTLTT